MVALTWSARSIGAKEQATPWVGRGRRCGHAGCHAADEMDPSVTLAPAKAPSQSASPCASGLKRRWFGPGRSGGRQPTSYSVRAAALAVDPSLTRTAMSFTPHLSPTVSASTPHPTILGAKGAHQSNFVSAPSNDIRLPPRRFEGYDCERNRDPPHPKRGNGERIAALSFS